MSHDGLGTLGIHTRDVVGKQRTRDISAFAELKCEVFIRVLPLDMVGRSERTEWSLFRLNDDLL